MFPAYDDVTELPKGRVSDDISRHDPTAGLRLVPRVGVLQTVTFIVFDPLLPSPWSVRPPLTAARSI